MPHYSLLMTSCQRDDLMELTLRSFFEQVGDYPNEIIIMDDGPHRPMPQFLQAYAHMGLRWITTGRNMGQVYCCDRLMEECSNEYVFWCEEDWEFEGGEFLRPSMAILQAYPTILQVWLRREDCAYHPNIQLPQYPFEVKDLYKGWSGFSWNPGLRRRSDWQRIGSYGAHASYDTHSLGGELRLNTVYRDLGYHVAILPQQHVHHIGGQRSCIAGKLHSPMPRILLAVPACWAFEYGRWESGESPRYDPQTAWQGRPYGTDIHISGPNSRTPAVRETWAKDVEAFGHVDLRFFYGGQAPRPLLDDEVLLRCEDDYEHLPHKTIAIMRWALNEHYDYILKVDDDTFVYVDRMVRELLEHRGMDYGGWDNCGMASGGAGYWLSRRAMEKVQDNPDHWAEDVWVGKCMQLANFSLVNLPNHRVGFSQHWADIEHVGPHVVTLHAVTPESMRILYQRKSCPIER